MVKLITINEEKVGKGRGSRSYGLNLYEDIGKKQSKSNMVKLAPLIKGKGRKDEGPKQSTIVWFLDDIYIIGGMDSNLKPKTDVMIYSMDPPMLSAGPSLNSGKCRPIVIPTCAELFVFSSILIGDGFDDEEDFPRCEVLTLHSSEWCGFDLDSALPPPPPSGKTSFRYEIDGYASGGPLGAYISVKKLCSYHVRCCYDGKVDWRISPNELPFTGEAKPLGHDKPFFYLGWSRPHRSDECGCIGTFKLVPDTDDADIFYFETLEVFSLLYAKTPQPWPQHMSSIDWLIYPLSISKVCVIHCVESSDSNSNQQQFILADVWELIYNNPDRRKRKNPVPNLKLLWHKTYPNMPPLQNWCFIPDPVSMPW